MKSSDDLKNRIKDHRSLLILAEIGATLHDIGKLSNVFIEYRREWRKGQKWNYFNDPHDNKFFDNHDTLLKKNFSDVIKNFNKECDSAVAGVFGKEAIGYSIKRAVDEHTNSQLGIIKFLKAADGVDAAIDRNNPLFSADQTWQIFCSNVYGFEGKEIETDKLDSMRGELYKFFRDDLENYLSSPSPDKREEIFGNVKRIFEQSLSDTTRPQNDTSLWEHCYAVASINKAILIHKLIYEESLDEFEKVRFGILGVGWDGISFMAAGHKLGDVVGRKVLIDELKEKIKEKIEYEYLLGNTIYEDDNCICFLVPALIECEDLDGFKFDRYKIYGELLQKLEGEIIERAFNITEGDLLPQFYLIPDTKYMTHIVKCLDGLRMKVNTPVVSPIHSQIIDKLISTWSGKKYTVCQVCGRRPVKQKDAETCKTCEKRRVKIWDTLKKKETPFISEIVLGNKTTKGGTYPIKRAAIIIARFGLRNWLNGKMERTLFVTESRGLEKELGDLGNTKDFTSDELTVKRWLTCSSYGNLIVQGYDYSRIKREIDCCYKFNDLQDEKEKEFAKNTVFLYDRRVKDRCLNRKPEDSKKNWYSLLQAATEEYELEGQAGDWLLYNIICTKTPTPSTVLNAWMATEDFFKEIGKEEKGKFTIKDSISTRYRLKLNIIKTESKNDELIPGAVYFTSINQKEFEVVIAEGKDYLLIISESYETKEKALEEGEKLSLKSEIELREDKRGGVTGKCLLHPSKALKIDDYYPLRIITQSPELFLAIVPADKTLGVSQRIYEEYINHFGKVMGRLPFSIGNLFFDEHMPMFIVLDSARRMLKSFEKLSEQPMTARIAKPHQSGKSMCDNFEVILDKVGTNDREIIWKLPWKLGNENVDFHHPYFIIGSEPRGYEFRKGYFKTIAGEVIHYSELQPGDEIKISPCYYDFEYLDSTARRYDLLVGKDLRRKGMERLKTRPIFLDELSQKVVRLWNDLCKKDLLPGITDTQLRNLESLWLTKLNEWDVILNNPASENFLTWSKLVETSLLSKFENLRELEFQGRFEWLKSLIFSGIFFESLELKVRILKERIEEVKNE